MVDRTGMATCLMPVLIAAPITGNMLGCSRERIGADLCGWESGWMGTIGVVLRVESGAYPMVIPAVVEDN